MAKVCRPPLQIIEFWVKCIDWLGNESRFDWLEKRPRAARFMDGVAAALPSDRESEEEGTPTTARTAANITSLTETPKVRDRATFPEEWRLLYPKGW